MLLVALKKSLHVMAGLILDPRKNLFEIIYQDHSIYSTENDESGFKVISTRVRSFYIIHILMFFFSILISFL